jgi:hypothetical protein
MVVEVDVKGGRGAVGVADVPVDALRANLNAATASLAEAFRDIRKVGEFQLAEVEIGIEVTAEGGVQFIGTAKVGGSASISLKFAQPKTHS